jgi:glycosyltransferase involved in cell wall biosynthesis
MSQPCEFDSEVQSNNLPSNDALSVVQLHSHDYGGGAEAVVRLNHAGLLQHGHSSQIFVAQKTGNDDYISEIPYRRGFPGSRRLARVIESVTGAQYLYSPSFQVVERQFVLTPNIVHLHALHGAEGWADLRGVAKLASRYPLVCSLQDLWWLTGHCAYGMECDRWKTGCGQCPDLARYPAVPNDGTRWNWKRKRDFLEKYRLHFIAPSQWVKKQAAESPILRDSPIYVVPNPIDTDVFIGDGRDEARQRLGIPCGRPTVLVAANHLDSPFKGGGDAIEVLNGLADTRTFAILIGKGSDALAKRISIPSLSLGYVDSVTKMADCYRAADVFLVPSRVETFGLVAAEAVACGTVVVAYQAGGLQEVVRTGHGIVVEDGDRMGLLRAVKHLLENLEDRAVRVAAGQPEVVRCYSPEAHARGCLDVYRRAIQEFTR